ncbi:MAG: hypothetical protein AAFO94_07605 [Bacteroidota bacterium]
MKKWIFCFVALFATVQLSFAQQACCAGKKASAVKAAMAEAAAQDDSIEQRKCPDTGIMCYFRKEKDAETGAVHFTKVEYDAASAKFVKLEKKGKAAGWNCSKMSCTIPKGQDFGSEEKKKN